MSKDKGVMEHVDENMAVVSRDARAFEILHESGAADAMMNAGAAKFAEFFVRVSTFAQFEALRRIDENKGYRFILARGRAQNRGCKDIREVCQALGFAIDRYYILQREVKEFGARRAQELEESGLGKPLRRHLLAAPKDVQKAAMDILGRENGDRKAAARAVADLVSALLDDERDQREQAERKTGELHDRAVKAEDKQRKTGEKLALTEEYLRDARAKAQQLEAELKTPSFIRDDKKIAKELDGLRLGLYALVGNIETVCDALAVRVQEGKPAEELNLAALHLLELICNMAGKTFGKYLPAFDPGQNHTAFWATHALFTSPGTKADIDDFQKTMSRLAGGKEAK